MRPQKRCEIGILLALLCFAAPAACRAEGSPGILGSPASIVVRNQEGLITKTVDLVTRSDGTRLVRVKSYSSPRKSRLSPTSDPDYGVSEITTSFFKGKQLVHQTRTRYSPVPNTPGTIAMTFEHRHPGQPWKKADDTSPCWKKDEPCPSKQAGGATLSEGQLVGEVFKAPGTAVVRNSEGLITGTVLVNRKADGTGNVSVRSFFRPRKTLVVPYAYDPFFATSEVRTYHFKGGKLVHETRVRYTPVPNTAGTVSLTAEHRNPGQAWKKADDQTGCMKNDRPCESGGPAKKGDKGGPGRKLEKSTSTQSSDTDSTDDPLLNPGALSDLPSHGPGGCENL